MLPYQSLPQPGKFLGINFRDGEAASAHSRSFTFGCHPRLGGSKARHGSDPPYGVDSKKSRHTGTTQVTQMLLHVAPPHENGCDFWVGTHLPADVHTPAMFWS